MKYRREHLVNAGLLSVVCLLVYLNSLPASLHYDDFFAITGNAAVQSLGNIREIFTVYPGRFILMYSFALNYFLGGADPVGYHVANLLFHAANALLFYFFVLTIAGKALSHSRRETATGVALVAGLLFAVHPLMTESVTYIAGRASSLAAVFFLGSLLLYVKGYADQPQNRNEDIAAVRRRKAIFYGASLFVFFLSMWVKESNATLPAIILLADFFFLEHGRWKRLQYSVLKSIPFFLVLLGILAWRKIYIGIIGDPFQVRDFLTNIFTQIGVTVMYLRLLLLPLGQNIDHDFPLSHSLFEVETLVSLIILLALAVISLALFKKNRLASFGILWFFITLTPTSVVPLWDVMSERWLYLPAAGIFLAAGSLVPPMEHLRLKVPAIKKALPITLALVVFLLGALTVGRNSVWRSEYTLWKDAAEKSPGKTRPHINLGMALADRGNLDEAIAELNTARSIDPAAPEADFGLSALYLRLGNFNETISLLSSTLARFPDSSLIPVRQADDFAKAHFNLGVAFFYKGRYDRALAEYRTALKLAPFLPWIHSNIGVVYEMQGEFAKALSEYRKELELHPGLPQVIQNIENVQRKIQQRSPAASER